MKTWEERLTETLKFCELANGRAADYLCTGLNVLPEQMRQDISAALSLNTWSGSGTRRKWVRLILLARMVTFPQALNASTIAKLIYDKTRLLDMPEAWLSTRFGAEVKNIVGAIQPRRISRDVVYLPRRSEEDVVKFGKELTTNTTWNTNLHRELIYSRPQALSGLSPSSMVYLLGHAHSELPLFSSEGTTWTAEEMAWQVERDGLSKLHKNITMLVCYGAQSVNSVAHNAVLMKIRSQFKKTPLAQRGPVIEKYTAAAKNQHRRQYYGEKDRVRPLGQQLSGALGVLGYKDLQITGFKGPVLMSLEKPMLRDQLILDNSEEDVEPMRKHIIKAFAFGAEAEIEVTDNEFVSALSHKKVYKNGVRQA